MSERRQWVDYSLSNERRHAAWRSVHARLRRPRRGPQLVAIAAVAAALVLLVRWWSAPAQPPHAGQSISTRSTALEFTLDDGSRLELSADSSLVVQSESDALVELRLVQGAALFDVARRPERLFRVEVNDVSVQVVGTRFKVERSTEQAVTVSVERGAVDVLRLGERRRLHPGESWSVRTPPSLAPEPLPAPARIDEVLDAGRVEASPSPKRSRMVPLPVAEPSADEVFNQLVSLRRAQEWVGAAEAARRFLDRFPADGRAGLVSFELGRIEMDRLASPAQAAVRLRRAAQLAPTAPFVEDALAREVRALDAAHDASACQQRRAAFLERFPQSLHRSSVQSACP